MNGSFILDDWGHAAAAQYSRDRILGDYWSFTANRPVLVLYMPFLHILLGPHASAHLAWALALAVLVSILLYALLRRLGFAAHHAGAVSLLVLLFPWSDSVRFWPTASHINLAVAFGIGGVLVAFRGLDWRSRGDRRRERLLHSGAGVLYALSVLTYEIAGVVLLLLVGALYLTRAPWPVVRVRWGLDGAIVVACLAWSGFRGDRAQLALGDSVDHGSMLASEAIAVLAGATLPFGSADEWIAIALTAAIAVVAVVMLRLRRLGGAPEAELRRWVFCMACGLAVALGGVGSLYTRPQLRVRRTRDHQPHQCDGGGWHRPRRLLGHRPARDADAAGSA